MSSMMITRMILEFIGSSGGNIVRHLMCRSLGRARGCASREQLVVLGFMLLACLVTLTRVDLAAGAVLASLASILVGKPSIAAIL